MKNLIILSIIVLMISGCSTPDEVNIIVINAEKEVGCPNGCLERKNGCYIKGLIGKGWHLEEKIYLLPSEEDYPSEEVHTQRGERWFCTEDEAKANGFRPYWNPNKAVD